MREVKCECPVKGHGGVKGKEYGTKELRRGREGVKSAVKVGRVGKLEADGRVAWEHSTGGEEQSGTGSNQARKIRSKF